MKLFSGNCGYILLTVFACLAVEGHYYNDHRDLLEEASGGRTCGTNIPTDEDRAQAAEVSRKWAATKLAFTDVQIEVFVHVITDSSGDGALAMVNITASMDHLNNAYSGTGFSFVLKGATCTENDAWYNSRLFSDEVAEMKSSLREGNEKTLNIYFKKLGGILGYAVFPVAYTNSPLQDGIVMRSDQYAGSDSARFGEGDTLVHEIGHWLGLFHVFDDFPGVFPFIYCLFGSDNDLIRDTPKSASPSNGCPLGKNSCRWRRGDDPINNFMDYSDDECMDEFTDNQVERMQDQWLEYRASGSDFTPRVGLPDGELCPPTGRSRP